MTNSYSLGDGRKRCSVCEKWWLPDLIVKGKFCPQCGKQVRLMVRNRRCRDRLEERGAIKKPVRY